MRQNPWGKLGAIVAAMLLSSGCAVSYEDSTGVRHVIGLAKVEVRRTAMDTPSLTGDVLVIKSFGLSVHQSSTQSSINLGHVAETSAFLHPCDLDIATSAQPCAKPATLSFLDMTRDNSGNPGVNPEAASDENKRSAARSWFGLLNFAFTPPDVDNGGNVTQVKTVGLSLQQNLDEQSLSLGYGQHTLVTPKANILVPGNPIADLDTARLHPAMRRPNQGHVQ